MTCILPRQAVMVLGRGDCGEGGHKHGYLIGFDDAA